MRKLDMCVGHFRPDTTEDWGALWSSVCTDIEALLKLSSVYEGQRIEAGITLSHEWKKDAKR